MNCSGFRARCGIGRSRSYELLQIADGRTTVEEIQHNANARKIEHRVKTKSPFRNGQNTDENTDTYEVYPAADDDDTGLDYGDASKVGINTDTQLR